MQARSTIFTQRGLSTLRESLNGGLLPGDFYAMAEQHAGEIQADVLTLKATPRSASDPVPNGGTTVAEAAPKTAIHVVGDEAMTYRTSQRTLSIRHAPEHDLVAMVEIVSPANKDRLQSVRRFVDKTCSAFSHGVHVMVVDLHEPQTHDPTGMHGAIWEELMGGYELPSDKPLTSASYVGQSFPEAYVEPLAVGDALRKMPLFLGEDWYVDLPLEETYTAAFSGMPGVWRKVLAG